MKLPTITKETQGLRKNDFCFPEEGEIAVFGFACDSDRNDIDGTCGCRRAMIGIKSQNASTTMAIREIDITPKLLKKRINEYLVETEWADLMSPKELKDCIDVYQRDLIRIGNCFPTGAVIEKRGDEFRNRKEKGWKPLT